MTAVRRSESRSRRPTRTAAGAAPSAPSRGRENSATAVVLISTADIRYCRLGTRGSEIHPTWAHTATPRRQGAHQQAAPPWEQWAVSGRVALGTLWAATKM